MKLNTEKQKLTFKESVIYLSFEILGCICFIFLFSMISIAQGENPAVISFSILMPTTIILIPAILLGPILSLFIWNNKNINTAKTITIVAILVVLVFGYIEWVMLTTIFLYGLICIFISTKTLTNISTSINEKIAKTIIKAIK